MNEKCKNCKLRKWMKRMGNDINPDTCPVKCGEEEKYHKKGDTDDKD